VPTDLFHSPLIIYSVMSDRSCKQIFNSPSKRYAAGDYAVMGGGIYAADTSLTSLIVNL
jgi:hypothetical protein